MPPTWKQSCPRIHEKESCQIAVRKSNGLRNRYPGGWSCREIGYHMRPSTALSGKDKLDGGTLYRNSRHRLKHRRRFGWQKHAYTGQGQHTRERPIEADGSRFGDLEMDTIIVKTMRGAIVTITERKTNYLDDEKADSWQNAYRTCKKTWRAMLCPYKHFLRTITTDNGSEFADHDFISKSLTLSFR